MTNQSENSTELISKKQLLAELQSEQVLRHRVSIWREA